MKILLAFSLIVATASSFSIDALERLIREELEETEKEEPKKVTLREYLESLDQPDPLYRARRADPNTFCDQCPTPSFPNATAKCESGRWKPNYEMRADGCECLTEYKCCNNACQPVDVKACGEGEMKGLEFGILEKDCCDCDVVKCLPCNSTTPEDEMCPRGAGARPKDCYTYTKHDSYSNDDRKCFLSHCVEKSSDANNKTCLKDCQREVERTTHCQFNEIDCENTQLLKDCPNKDLAPATAKLSKPTHCYGTAVEGDDDASGHYYDAETKICRKCQRWNHPIKSCAVKNEAAAEEDCHEYGEHEMDKKCFEKSISRDDCDCEVAECAYTTKPESEVFEPEEVCPKNHVKVSGVTICMQNRDICKKCPAFVPIKPTDCPNGKVVKEKGCNGCEVSKCERATLPSDDCACKTYKFDSTTNMLKCHCGYGNFYDFGATWHRFWWYDAAASKSAWPADESDVLGRPYGACLPGAAHCFGRLPQHLRQDSTQLLAIDGKGNIFKWKFDSANPTSNAAWRAFHDHAETKADVVRNNQIWNPEVLAGARSARFRDQDSFMYRDQYGIKSLILDDDNCDCLSTLSLGSGMCGGGQSTSYGPAREFGVDNLDDPYCETPKPTKSISLYYADDRL